MANNDKNTQNPINTDIGALLSTEEGKVVQREQMLLKVRECHTLEHNVKAGRRKGAAVYNRNTDPTLDLTDAQIFALARNVGQ